MSTTRPYFEVQITGSDSVVYTNQVAASDATFLKLYSATFKRSASQIASELVLNIDNTNGVYSSVFTKNLLVQMWVDLNDDGSAKYKVFRGSVVRKENSKTPYTPCKLTLTCKDGTPDLLNTLVFETITPGATRTGGDGVTTYTFSDFANIVKYLMSFSKYNPNGITVNNVQNAGSTISQPKKWQHKPTLNCIQDLALLANFDAYVDANNDLHFEPKISTEWPDELTMTTGGQIAQINELLDAEDEKTRIGMYCGVTVDDVNIVRFYRVPSDTLAPKTIWRRNIQLAGQATGSTVAERTASAYNICREAARVEYQKVKNRHEYRAVINQFLMTTVGSTPTYRVPQINDTMRLTSTDIGLSNTLLRVIEIEEKFSPLQPYSANYRFNDNLS